MRKQSPATKAAFERTLAEIHPDRDAALELLRLGVYRIDKQRRLRNGKCEAHARSTGKPCQRKALENGRCPNHGGLSTGPKTPEGRKRIGIAVAKSNRERWKRWRLERGRPDPT